MWVSNLMLYKKLIKINVESIQQKYKITNKTFMSLFTINLNENTKKYKHLNEFQKIKFFFKKMITQIQKEYPQANGFEMIIKENPTISLEITENTLHYMEGDDKIYQYNFSRNTCLINSRQCNDTEKNYFKNEIYQILSKKLSEFDINALS